MFVAQEEGEMKPQRRGIEMIFADSSVNYRHRRFSIPQNVLSMHFCQFLNVTPASSTSQVRGDSVILVQEPQSIAAEKEESL